MAKPGFIFNNSRCQEGITLLLGLLVLSAVLAISFSLATVLFVEVRSSGDLLRTETSYYGATAITEQALYKLKRKVTAENCDTSSFLNCYSRTVGSVDVSSQPPVENSIADPIQRDIVPPGGGSLQGTVFPASAKHYAIYNPACPSANSSLTDNCRTGGSGYTKIIVTYLNTGNSTPLDAYLCQFHPEYSVGIAYDSAPCTDRTDTKYWQSNAALTQGVTFIRDLDPSQQQELVLYNSGATAPIYVQIEAFDSSNNPAGIPYYEQTAVDINAQNAGVNRKIRVLVPNSGVTGSGNSGPLAYWKLDDTTFVDSSGNGDTGSCPGGLCPTLDAAGHMGSSGSFNGVSNYINLARSSLNQAPQWTFSTWVYPVGDGYIYTEGIPAVTFVVGISGGSVITYMWNQNLSGNWMTASSPAGSINYNTWNHVAVTLENGGVGTGTLKFYVNGVLVSTVAGQMEDNTSALYAALGDNIGAYGGGQGHAYFKGKLDEVRIYGRALSAGEISVLP